MISDDLQAHREAVVTEHMRAEMAGDLDATLATFTGEPEYDIVPLPVIRRGHDEVRHLLANLPRSVSPISACMRRCSATPTMRSSSKG